MHLCHRINVRNSQNSTHFNEKETQRYIPHCYLDKSLKSTIVCRRRHYSKGENYLKLRLQSLTE